MAVDIGINEPVTNVQTVALEIAIKPRVRPVTSQSAVSVFDTNSIIVYILADHSHPKVASPNMSKYQSAQTPLGFNEMGDF